ncbi:phasin [Nitratireductor indicus]|uniref:Phasin n=1 Tax=Nitratireductor indicus C115 TaxID=1231190 RepID=K2N047_9HYPH|nr:phasin [Nitratireductor indicus]EKF40893.1 phasin [Nitratireductor indicus C115]MDS1138635.1 phasin [Nitratireductor indicus]SFQ33010.1 phasin [Nitratireductor indicus]
MTKTTQKETEALEFPTFDATKANEQFRAFAEKSTEQTKEIYARMKAGAEDAQKAFEQTFETAKTAGNEFTSKSIAAMREGAEANLAHLEALAGARSLADLIEMQSSFLRKRMEVAVDQMKEFQVTSQKSVETLSKPMKDVFEKAFKEVRVA